MDLANDLSLQQLSPDEIKRQLASTDILEFTKYTMPEYQVNWHHKLICQKLEDFVNRKIKRLMVFLPPRSGKSELVSRRLPAYILGQDPDASIIATSYGADLASRMNRDVQKIMTSPEYSEIFPNTRLPTKGSKSSEVIAAKRTSEFFEVIGHKGAYRSAGVGGGITGMGSSYAIVDDVIKNAEEAESETYRKKIWEWYQTTLYTRLEKDACILITLTRWHEDDLAGRLLEKMSEEDSEQWEVLSIPMIKEDNSNLDDPRKPGEVLWPEKFDQNRVNKIRNVLGSRYFQALHQQTPVEAKGNLVSRAWWSHYDTLPPKFDYKLISWDFTFKGKSDSDYVVGQLWGQIGMRKFLIDQVRGQMSFTQSLQAMIDFNRCYQDVNENVVEDKANGPAILDALKDVIPNLTPYEPKGSKFARAVAVTPQIQNGQILIPHPDLYPWVEEFLKEWSAFPNGKSDDQVDATSMGIRALENRTYGWAGFARKIENQEDKQPQLHQQQHSPISRDSVSEDLKSVLWGKNSTVW